MKKSELRNLIREEVVRELTNRVLTEGEDFLSLAGIKRLMDIHAKNINMYKGWLKSDPGMLSSERKIIQSLLDTDKRSFDALHKLYKVRVRR